MTKTIKRNILFDKQMGHHPLGYNDSWNAPSSLDNHDDLILAANSTPVPEPATMFLLGTGLIGLAGLKRKKYL